MPLCIVRQERIGGNAARRLDDALDGLHGQERLRILRHEGRASGLEEFAAEGVLDGGGIPDQVGEDVMPGSDRASASLQRQAKRLRQVPLTDGAHREFLPDLLEIQHDTVTFGLQPLVQFRAHALHLGVGFRPDGLELPKRLAGKDGRARQSLAADVRPARIVRVIDPQPRSLVLRIQRDELDAEQREKPPPCTSFLPLPIPVGRVEVIDSHDLHAFFRRLVQCLPNRREGTERVRSMQMSVNV